MWMSVNEKWSQHNNNEWWNWSILNRMNYFPTNERENIDKQTNEKYWNWLARCSRREVKTHAMTVEKETTTSSTKYDTHSPNDGWGLTTCTLVSKKKKTRDQVRQYSCKTPTKKANRCEWISSNDSCFFFVEVMLFFALVSIMQIVGVLREKDIFDCLKQHGHR